LLGFGAVAFAAAGFAKILFFIFLILFCSACFGISRQGPQECELAVCGALSQEDPIPNLEAEGPGEKTAGELKQRLGRPKRSSAVKPEANNHKTE
jgi:hypothetical protein